MKSILLLSFFLCTLGSTLFADEEGEKEKPMIEEKIEVIGRVPLSRAMESVSVLNKDDIRNFNPDGLKELLNQSPGMLVLNAGNQAQFAYSFARGASVNQMLYLVDGVKLYDPSSALAGNFSFLSPQLIEKVEIVRGPLSNLYGSSAMGGVVNIITRKKEGLSFSLSGGSHGTLESDVHFGKRLSDFFVFLNCDFLNYDEALSNDQFERRGFSVNSGYEKNDFSMGVSLFGTVADAGIPMNMGVSTPKRNYEQNNFLLSLPVAFPIGAKSRFAFTASLHWNNYDFTDPDDAWNYSFTNGSQVAELQAKFSTGFLEKVNWISGFDFSRQQVESSNNGLSLMEDIETDVFSLYTDLQADLDKLLLSGSLRYDKYRGLAAVFSPHFGASYNLTPSLKLRASISRSFRAPSLPEMFNPYWGNSGLLPETGRSSEVGADLFFASLVCGFTYFDSSYTNLIGYSPLTAKFTNISKAEIKGAEASCDWKLGRGLNWRTAYTFLQTRDAQYDRPLLRRPRHALTASLLFRNPKWTLSAEMGYVGKRLDYDEILWTICENKPFNHFAFMLNVPLPKNFNVFFRVSNAFNSRFEEVLGYPAPLRRIVLGFAYRVEK